MFKLLDEDVKVGETIMVWLKDEALLRSEGWQDYRTSSLKREGSPLIIGKTKRKMLGDCIRCTAGKDEKGNPVVFTADGYRFAPGEIKAVVKLEKSEAYKPADISTVDGSIIYSPKSRSVTLPNGLSFSDKWLPYLKRLIREVGA